MKRDLQIWLARRLIRGARLDGGAADRAAGIGTADGPAPDGENLVALMAACDRLAEEILRLVEQKRDRS